MEFLAEKDATSSPSQDSLESDVDEYVWKILLGAKEELQNASEVSFQSASHKQLPANDSSVFVSVIQKEKRLDVDQSNASLTAEVTVATDVITTDHAELNLDSAGRSSDSPVMTDVTPLRLPTSTAIPVMTDATSLGLDSSLVKNGSPEMIKKPEKCLVTSNKDSSAVKSSSDTPTIVEDSVIFTRAEPKLEDAFKDQVPEGSAAKSKKPNPKFARSNKVFPLTGETMPSEWDDVIRYTGSQDHNGNDVFVLDLRKLLKDKYEYHHCAALCSHLTSYITGNLTTPSFVLLVKTDKHKTRYSLAKEIYQVLKNSFSDKLSSCLVDRPAAKLKGLFYVCKPFLQRKMRNKICIVKTAKSMEGHGIPDTVLQLL